MPHKEQTYFELASDVDASEQIEQLTLAGATCELVEAKRHRRVRVEGTAAQLEIARRLLVPLSPGRVVPPTV